MDGTAGRLDAWPIRPSGLSSTNSTSPPRNAPNLADLGHQIAALIGEQRSERARDHCLNQAMLFSLRAEAAHAIDRHDVDAAVRLNGLADEYGSKLAHRRRGDSTD